MFVYQFIRICHSHPYYTYTLNGEVLCIKERRVIAKYYKYRIKHISLIPPNNIVFDLFNITAENYKEHVELYKNELLEVLDPSIPIETEEDLYSLSNPQIKAMWIEEGKIIF